MSIYSDDELSIETLDDHHAQPIFELVEQNRPFLRTWLTWLDNLQTAEHFHNFIQGAKHRMLNHAELSCVIMENGQVAGRIGLYYIDQSNKIASIGYWLGESYQGKGIITRACKAIIKYGFTTMGLNRIEIKCAVENHKSQAIPERLGFSREGILRQAELLNGQFVDLYLYSMLKSEWKG